MTKGVFGSSKLLFIAVSDELLAFSLSDIKIISFFSCRSQYFPLYLRFYYDFRSFGGINILLSPDFFILVAFIDFNLLNWGCIHEFFSVFLGLYS